MKENKTREPVNIPAAVREFERMVPGVFDTPRPDWRLDPLNPEEGDLRREDSLPLEFSGDEEDEPISTIVYNVAARTMWKEVERLSHGPARASDFVADREVLAANIACVYCGGKAAWSTVGPAEDFEKCKKRALCLDCRAKWQDYARDEKARNILDKTGRAWKSY